MCVWSGVDTTQENNTVSDVGKSFIDRWSPNDKYISTKKGRLKNRKYCIVMMSKHNYDFYVVDCRSLICNFVCKRIPVSSNKSNLPHTKTEQ